MSKRCLIEIFVSFLFLLMLFGSGYAGIEFESKIPTQTIVIDGLPDDWEGVQPFFADVQGDSICNGGTDFKEAYLAKDDTYLYWRIDIWGENFELGLDKFPMIHFSDDCEPNCDTAIKWQWFDAEDEGRVLVRVLTPELHYDHIYFGPEYGVIAGPIAEGKIPLSLFKDFQITGVNLCYYSGDFYNPCDIAIWYPSPSNKNKIDYMWLQHRKYEDGREYNRLCFQLKDETGNWISEDIIESVELTDPNGNLVSISDGMFEQWEILYGRYDCGIGQWIYDDKFVPSSSYFYFIDEPLIEGNYHLTLFDRDGNIYEGDYMFNGLANLPVIPRRSFRIRFDRFGNFIWEWAVPYYIDPGLETSVKAFIYIYNHEDMTKFLHVSVPTHMGRIFVPSEIVEMIKAEGDRVELVIELRTNDNNNRTYSNPRKLPLGRFRMLPRQSKLKE